MSVRMTPTTTTQTGRMDIGKLTMAAAIGKPKVESPFVVRMARSLG